MMKTILFFAMVLLIVGATAWAKTSISDIEIVEWHLEKQYGTIWLVGELKNNGDTAVGVELQATMRDKQKRIIDTCSWWPASVKNIPSGASWPIKYPVSEKRNVHAVELRIIGIKVWR